MKPHYNENGEICNCGFGRYNEPVEENLTKEAGAKLDWIRDREDKFFQTEEGQLIFNTLEAMINHPGGEKIDPLVPWLWREAKKKRIDRSGLDFHILTHLADWYASNSPTRRGVDIMQLTTDEVTQKVAEWDEELAAKMAEAEIEAGRVVAELDDGWTIQQVTTEEGAKQEGDAMGHCVGGYGHQIVSGETLIYSLRDPKNQPHATIEIQPDYENNKEIVEQIRKFQNVHNLVNTHFPTLRALVKAKATNDQIRETIENIIENTRLEVEYQEFVDILRARLEDKEKEYYNEKISDFLTQLDPSDGAVIQIQGKENKMPVEKYQGLIGNWLLGFETPPYYEKSVYHVYLEAPTTLDALGIWTDPSRDEYGYVYDRGEYEQEFIRPRTVSDYFPEGQEHGYLHDMEGGETEDEIYRQHISDAHWESILIDAFSKNDKDSVMQLLQYVSEAEKVEPNQQYSSQFADVVADFARDEIYPEFKTRYFNDQSGISEAKQWAAIPEGQYINILLGYNYIDPNEEIGPPEAPEEQNILFGPGVTDEWQAQRDQFQKTLEESNRDDPVPLYPTVEEGPLIEQNVPWQDPRNIDYLKGRFGSRFRKWFRRKANILDPIHNALDPNVWDDPYNPRPSLKPEIGDWIRQTITSALERHGYTHMEEWMSLVVTGSLTTYQYSNDSDCDVSLFVNAERFPDWSRAEMIAIMMQECDDSFVPGTSHPLQCYVVPEGFQHEDLYKPGLRSAYSIDDNRWIVPPEKDRVHDVTREMNEAYTIALENADKMEKLIRYEPIKAVQYYKQVHSRRRRDHQQGKGDFAPSNISYKMMESRGLFDQIKSLMKQYQIK